MWRYELGDSSLDAVRGLGHDPAIADTNYIDRSTYAVDDATVTVATRLPWILEQLPFPFSTDNRFESVRFLFHVQSLCLIAAGCVAAAFPAFFAGAWLCARERRHTAIAAAILISAHLAFWRIVLDTRFVNRAL